MTGETGWREDGKTLPQAARRRMAPGSLLPVPARRHRRGFLALLGPGLVTGASDDDPGGIATFSQAGAQFGFGLCWVLLFSAPLMAAIQEISARIGLVTGTGIAGNIRAHYSPWLLRPMVALLLIANIINLGADLGAMGAAVRLLAGGPARAYVVGFAVLSAGLEIFLRYERYVAILKWLTLSLFAYVATALAVRVPWAEVVRATFVPQISLGRDYIVVLVAALGTTISPYCFFWQASQEAEDERVRPEANPLVAAPEQAPAEIRRLRLDTYIGMGFSNLVSWFILVTAAATLHMHGITDVQTSEQAAEALRPFAGPLAFAVFAAGIVGTGLLAVPTLAGSAAYACGEAFGWRVGLGRRPRRAKAFYGTIVVATLLGIAINFVHIDPIKALVWSAVINGVVAVPLMVTMMVMAMQPKVMRQFTLPRPLWAMGWLTTGVMAATVVALVWTSLG
ncbi:MAG TPA: Nramp family divalent metal transporter [Stellaceae bacterium]|nr:Nramp family divalent metal transporter [Stellaceae bacterium]